MSIRCSVLPSPHRSTLPYDGQVACTAATRQPSQCSHARQRQLDAFVCRRGTCRPLTPTFRLLPPSLPQVREKQEVTPQPWCGAAQSTGAPGSDGCRCIWPAPTPTSHHRVADRPRRRVSPHAQRSPRRGQRPFSGPQPAGHSAARSRLSGHFYAAISGYESWLSQR